MLRGGGERERERVETIRASDKGAPVYTCVCVQGATNGQREEGFIARDLLLLPGGAAAQSLSLALCASELRCLTLPGRVDSPLRVYLLFSACVIFPLCPVALPAFFIPLYVTLSPLPYSHLALRGSSRIYPSSLSIFLSCPPLSSLCAHTYVRPGWLAERKQYNTSEQVKIGITNYSG